MARTIFPRNNWFDGQNVTESDMDVEQDAWTGTIANAVDLTAGSGVEQEFPVQRILFDTDSVPASIQSLLDTENFDGEPIYSEDSFGNTVFLQPSDSSQGNQLDIEITDADLLGSATLKVYIFGTTFGGEFREEVFTFRQNGSQITRNYYTEIVAIMTQDFRGNQNDLIDGLKSRDSGGRLRVLEALPMRLARDPVMASQTREPNQNYVNFKPATLFKTLDVLLDEISASAGLNKDDLGVNLTSTTTRTLPANQTGLIIGQKFQATTDNIQKVQLLLAVEERQLVPPGQEFNWTGDIVVGIRKLRTVATCPTDTVPGTPIEFDPEPAPIAEVSFDRAGLEQLGISLTDTPQVVDFIFTQSSLADPNTAPSIVPGDYYMLTVRRAGNVSVGTIVLQEAANTDANDPAGDNQRMSVFSQNVWTDVPTSDMWYSVYTDALRIVDGTAYVQGRQLTSPKVSTNLTTGLEEPYIEGEHSFVDTSQDTDNFLIVQFSEDFSTATPHPATGNLIFTRINDAPNVAIVSEDTLTTLLDAGTQPIIVGAAKDTNPVDNPQIFGQQKFPGLVREDTFTIINPSSDILINNLVGSILIPNTGKPNLQYRIIKKEVFNDAYGDINNDGVIDLNDVARSEALGNVVSGDGYSKSLTDGSVPDATQQAAIVNEFVTMEEIIRADVTDDGIVTVLDVGALQQHIALGRAFDSGSTFTRVVLTVENLTDPLTTDPDIIGTDSVFNAVPFTPVDFRIDFIPLWDESNIILEDLRRFIPKTFTDLTSENLEASPRNGGINTSFVPGDLLLGGEVFNIDGTQHRLDYEMNTIVMELPDGYTRGEIDIFNNFIKNRMTFSDGTLVPSTALVNNQIRVTTALQSHVKDQDGYDFESADGYAAIDETIAVLYTQSSGIMRVRAGNIRNIPTRPELRTKLILTVHLKKAGFNNTPITVRAQEFSDLLIPIT